MAAAVVAFWPPGAAWGRILAARGHVWPRLGRQGPRVGALKVAYDCVQDLVWDDALQSKNQLHRSVCKITLLKVYNP